MRIIYENNGNDKYSGKHKKHIEIVFNRHLAVTVEEMGLEPYVADMEGLKNILNTLMKEEYSVIGGDLELRYL